MEKTEVAPLYNKLSSVNLCSNLTGQILTDMMVCPPKEGEASYEEYWNQYNTAMNSYKNRAKTLVSGLNKIPGITSNPIEGAMYAFPQIEIPDAYRRRAGKEHVNPDFLWCMDLLENERVVVVPGSGFEQVPGTYHFRTTILPGEEDMDDVVERVTRHQNRILEEYGPNSKYGSGSGSSSAPKASKTKRSKSPVAGGGDCNGNGGSTGKEATQRKKSAKKDLLSMIAAQRAKTQTAQPSSATGGSTPATSASTTTTSETASGSAAAPVDTSSSTTVASN